MRVCTHVRVQCLPLCYGSLEANFFFLIHVYWRSSSCLVKEFEGWDSSLALKYSLPYQWFPISIEPRDLVRACRGRPEKTEIQTVVSYRHPTSDSTKAHFNLEMDSVA